VWSHRGSEVRGEAADNQDAPSPRAFRAIWLRIRPLCSELIIQKCACQTAWDRGNMELMKQMTVTARHKMSVLGLSNGEWNLKTYGGVGGAFGVWKNIVLPVTASIITWHSFILPFHYQVNNRLGECRVHLLSTSRTSLCIDVRCGR